MHAWIDGGGDWPTERIPRSMIKPVEECVPAMRDEILCGTEVEPRIELVDDAAVPVDGMHAKLVRKSRRLRERRESGYASCEEEEKARWP